jgi:hypothetical protein
MDENKVSESTAKQMTSTKRNRIKNKIKYFNIWMEYKGKKLRILVGVRRETLSCIDINDGTRFIELGTHYSVAFAFQSPWDQDNFITAKNEVQSNMFDDFGDRRFSGLTRKKINPTNLVQLAFTYPILKEDVSWVKKSHFLYIDEVM